MKKKIKFSIVIILILGLAFFYDGKTGDQNSPVLNPYVYEENLEFGEREENSYSGDSEGIKIQISGDVVTDLDFEGKIYDYTENNTNLFVVNEVQDSNKDDNNVKTFDESKQGITSKDSAQISSGDNQSVVSENSSNTTNEVQKSNESNNIIIESENDEIILRENYCFLSVKCNTILDNIEIFDEEKIYLLNGNGIIFEEQIVCFEEGDSVFDVLKREMINNKIHLEFNYTPIYNSAYIEGINNIYEFDCGDLSGWMYSVNGVFPNYGCSSYIVEANDKIEFVYTCDLGNDVGGGIR